VLRRGEAAKLIGRIVTDRSRIDAIMLEGGE
jgi:hypothetical protein